MESNSSFGLVLVTAGNLTSAKAIATLLITEKLAACVNILPITSIYMWQGKINEDPEYQLIIKTDLDKFDRLAAKVSEIHPYEVPEIIALPIENGADSYLSWLGETMK